MDIDPENFKDWDMCPDCKGKGCFTSFQWNDPCSKCDGAGWIPKGTGWDRTKWLAWSMRETGPKIVV